MANVLKNLLGDRGIDPLGLETPIRRVIFTTYAVLLGLALATALRDGMAIAGVYIAQPGVEIPKGVAWISAFGAALSVALMLAGAAHARTRWRYLLVAPILIGLAFTMLGGPHGQAKPFPTWVGLLFLTPVIFLIASVVVTAVAPKMRTRWVLNWLLALVAGLFITILALSVAFWESYAPTALLLLMGVAAICLQPALLVVGWDIAEISDESGEHAMSLLDRLPPIVQRGVHLALIAAALAGAVTLHLLKGYAFNHGRILIGIWIGILALAAIAAFSLAMRRPKTTTPGHITYQQVLVTAIIFTAIFFALMSFETKDEDYFTHERGHQFSIKVPDGMAENPGMRFPTDKAVMDSPRTDVRVNFLTAGKLPNLTIFGAIRPPFRPGGEPMPSLNTIVKAGGLPPIQVKLSEPGAHRWRYGEGSVLNKAGHTLHFLVYKREVDSGMNGTAMDWYVICGGGDADLVKMRAMCDKAHRNFFTTIFTKPSRPAAMWIDGLIFAVAAGAFALAARNRNPARGPLLDFVFWSFLLVGLNVIGGYIFGGEDEALFNVRFATDLVSAILVVFASIAAVAEAWPERFAKSLDLTGAREVFARLNASLCVLGVAFYLYVFAASHAEHSQAIRGVVVCLALTWELLTAGGTVNGEGEHHTFPRSSRILIFAGYLMLVATTVFMFGKLEMIASGYTVGAYETEVVVASGMVLLGAAFLISRAFRRLSALRADPPPPALEATPDAQPL